MSDEDKRAAVGISVNLSTQLIAAALATLAVEGAYVAYALGDRDVKDGFIVLCIISTLLLVASIFVAGKGITNARNAGYKGQWDLSVGKTQFNLQAMLCVLALLAFGVALLQSGATKADDLQNRVLQLYSDMQGFQQRLSTLGDGHNTQEKTISDMRTELLSMKKELQTIAEESKK